jgi:hypothetical protein
MAQRIQEDPEASSEPVVFQYNALVDRILELRLPEDAFNKPLIDVSANTAFLLVKSGSRATK